MNEETAIVLATRKPSPYLPWAEARAVVHSHKFQTARQFKDWHAATKPKNIPIYPHRIYTTKFTTWNDWIGIENREEAFVLPYDEARRIVKEVQLNSQGAYVKWVKETKPYGFVTMPERAYPIRGVKFSWHDFLGKAERKALRQQRKVYREKKKAEITPPKPRSKYLPWEEARAFVRSQNLRSILQYKEWHQREKPAVIPAAPERVYGRKIKFTWNDYLGVDNKWGGKVKERRVKYRPFYEAVKWVHTLKLRTKEDWNAYCSTAENFPEDIPKRPDLDYKEWRGWGFWNGFTNDQVKHLEVQKEVAQRTTVFVLYHTPDVPSNVVTFEVFKDGLSAFKQRWEEEQFNIIMMFWHDPVKFPIVMKAITSSSSSYYGQPNVRIVSNLWGVTSFLQRELDQVTPKDVQGT